MIDDRDIYAYAAANVMIARFGEGAKIEAAMRPKRY